MNYFMGSGADDPWLHNSFNFEGLEVSPDGTASKIGETPSMAGYSPNEFLLNEGMSNGGENDDYGYVVDAHRDIQVWECWFEEWGVPLVYLGERGVASDVTEAEIAYSASEVGQERDNTTQPFFGVWGNDDRAHINAKALGGDYVSGNLTSQSPSINRGPVRAFENGIRKTLTDHKDWHAFLRVEALYRTPDCESPIYRTAWYYRPYEFRYSVNYTTRDGKTGVSASLTVRNPLSWRDFF